MKIRKLCLDLLEMNQLKKKKSTLKTLFLLQFPFFILLLLFSPADSHILLAYSLQKSNQAPTPKQNPMPRLFFLNLLDIGLSTSSNNSIIWDVTFPERMSLPHPSHLFNRNPSRLRQQEVDEDGHDQNHSSKEVEESKFHVAKHRQEELSNEEREEHVDRNIDGLSRWSYFQWTYLTWY